MKIITQIKKLIILALLVTNVFSLKSFLENENSNNIKNTIKEVEQEEAKIAGKINNKLILKGTSEKHKKSHTTIQKTVASKAKVVSKAKTAEPVNPQPTGNSKVQSFDSPILVQLWVKYFKYTNAELNVKTPKTFFVNSGFYQQTKLYPNADITKGNDFIKTKNNFYLSIFKNSLVFKTSKNVKK